jgi:hypothetical protein
MWGALSDERTGLPFTVAAGPRQRSNSWVRVPRDSLPYFTVSDSRLPQPGGSGPRNYIAQEQGGPVIPPGTGCKPINVYIKCFLLYNYFILDTFYPDTQSPVAGWLSCTSRHRVPFSSPPTTRRATVEVFKPASTWGYSWNLVI